MSPGKERDAFLSSTSSFLSFFFVSIVLLLFTAFLFFFSVYVSPKGVTKRRERRERCVSCCLQSCRNDLFSSLRDCRVCMGSPYREMVSSSPLMHVFPMLRHLCLSRCASCVLSDLTSQLSVSLSISTTEDWTSGFVSLCLLNLLTD